MTKEQITLRLVDGLSVCSSSMTHKATFFVLHLWAEVFKKNTVESKNCERIVKTTAKT